MTGTEQFHNPKDLAISISLEAAELLESSNGAQKTSGVRRKKKKSGKSWQTY